MTPIQEDGATNESEQPFDAEGAFMKLFESGAPKEPLVEDEATKKKAAEADEEDTTEPEADADTSDQEVQDESDEGKKDTDDETADDEDAEDEFLEGDSLNVKVKAKVDGEDREFSVKDLVRLAGQESSLTRKSQEVATKRKQIDDAAAVQAAALEKVLARARERYEPYSKVDFLVAAQQLDAEQLSALRTEAVRAYEDVKFYETELGELGKQIQTRVQADHADAAKKCIEALTDPDTGIKGWNEEMYRDIIGYAKTAGIAPEIADSLTDPSAFKLIQKAMLYDKGKAKVTVTEDKAKKKAPPKKIVKTTTSPNASTGVATKKAADAMQRLRTTGTFDDALAAFEARAAQGDD